jgi:hypothetical protein
MLSVLVSSGELTDAQVIAVCSDIRPYKVGDTVWVTAPGNLRTKMIVVAIEVDYVFVQPLISSGSGSPSALRVSRDRVRALDSIVCTLHQIGQAKIHAATYFPGAKVVPVITRSGGIQPNRAEFVAQFLREKSVSEYAEASQSNASKN